MPAKGIKIARPCERCGTVSYLLPSRFRRGQGRFCSRACKNAPRPLAPHSLDPHASLVTLTQGLVAVIDNDDAERVGRRNWQAVWSGNQWYARSSDYAADQDIFLHRFVMDAKPGEEVDHKDGDTMNCRKGNLRLVTHQQNQCNTRKRSGTPWPYKGVRGDRGRWTARIGHEGKSLHLGTFDTAEDAARAYDTAAHARFGEYARLNLPHERHADSNAEAIPQLPLFETSHDSFSTEAE